MADRAKWKTLEKEVLTQKCGRCSGILTVAFFEGDYHKRCGSCGYDPPVEEKKDKSLIDRYKDGDFLTAIDTMQLHNLLTKMMKRYMDTDREPPRKLTQLYLEVKERFGIQ